MLKRLHFGYDSGRQLLAIASGPQKLHLWRTSPDGDAPGSRDEPDLELSTDRSKIVGLHLQPGGLLVTVHEAGVAAAWTLDEGEDGLAAEFAWEESLDFRPALVASCDRGDGQLAVAGKMGDLVVLEPGADSGRVITLEGHSSEITAVTFDDAGGRLASGDRDHTLYIWDTAELDDASDPVTPAFELGGCESWPLSMRFSSDARRLAAGAMDNGVYLWALAEDDGEMVGCVFQHHGWIVDVAWAPDDSIVAAASWDNTIGLYGRERLRPRFAFEYHRDYVSALCFHDDNLYSGGYDHKVCRWRWRDAEFAGVVEAHGDWVLGMIELDQGRMATLSSDHTVRIWKLPEFELMQTLGSGVSSGFDLGASVDMSSFVDGGGASSDQLEDRRPPRAEMPPGRLDAVRKLDASGTSATAQTAFGMLESELGDNDLDADSAFESDEDLELAASDSVTQEYDSEAELGTAADDFTSEADDLLQADAAQTGEDSGANEEEKATREVDPEEIDPSIFDLGGDVEEAPELDIDSGAYTADGEDEPSAADLSGELDIDVEEAPELDIDSEELPETADEAPPEASLDVDLDMQDDIELEVEDSASIDLDAELDTTDPDELSLDVEDEAPKPEERAEDALEDEADAETATDIDPDADVESHAEEHDEVPDEVDEELELEPQPDEPASDALGQLESSIDASSSAEDDVELDIEFDESGDEDVSDWVDVSDDLDDELSSPDADDAADEDEEAAIAVDEDHGAELDVALEGDVGDEDDDAADAFVSSDFGDGSDEDDQLGALSSGTLSPGDQDESIDQELDQVSAGDIDPDAADASADEGMGDLLDESPDEFGLGDISSADLDVELGSNSVDTERDVPGLDRMSFPDQLDVNSESLETHAEIDEASAVAPNEPLAEGAAPEPDAGAVEQPPSEGHNREKRSPDSGDADEADEDSEDAEQDVSEPAEAPPKKTKKKSLSLKDKLKAALSKKKAAESKDDDESENDSSPVTPGRPNEERETRGENENESENETENETENENENETETESSPVTPGRPNEERETRGDPTPPKNNRRAKLKAALSKLGKRSKDKKKSSPEKPSGALPRPGAPKPSSEGEDTPASELGFDLGIGDDLADTLSQLMPEDEADEAPPEAVEEPSVVEDEPAEVTPEPEEEEVAAPEPEPEMAAAPGSEVEDEDQRRNDDKSMLIELVDVVEEPEEEEEEIVGPDPNYQSGETLTSIRPMSLASEAEETPGLRLPNFGGGDQEDHEDDESDDELVLDEPVDDEVVDEPEDEFVLDEPVDDEVEEPEDEFVLEDPVDDEVETPGGALFAQPDEALPSADESPTSERASEDEPVIDEPDVRESGDEVTPAGDIVVPDAAKENEDATKQVSAADLQFIRSSASPPSPESEVEEEEAGSDLSVPGLQSETAAEHAGEPSQPSMVHSELADIWIGRSAGSLYGKGIIRPSPDERAEFAATKSLETPHRWIYGVGRLVERGLLCVCGGDDTVSIFEESGDHVSSLRVPEDGLNDIAVVALGSVLFAAGDDGYIYAWTLPNDSLQDAESIARAAVSGHDGWVTSLDVDVDNQLLVSGSFDNTARVWALDGSADPLVLDGHDGAVSGVAMTERGPVTGGHDGTVRFWTTSGLQVDQLDGYGKVLSVKSGADLVVWTTADGEVHVRGPNGVRELETHDTQATTVAIDERGGIASADKRGQVRLYAPGETSPFQTLELESAIWAMHLTESQLTVGTDAGKLQFFERE